MNFCNAVNETFLVILKHCDIVKNVLNFRAKMDKLVTCNVVNNSSTKRNKFFSECHLVHSKLVGTPGMPYYAIYILPNSQIVWFDFGLVWVF